jgi:mono/diheme cytochrome c family protein
MSALSAAARELAEQIIMQNASFKWLMVVGVIGACNTSVVAQELDAGRSEYQAQCASCHGIDGKGSGPISGELKTPPTDLTTLAKKNNGVFPISVIYEVIDGRKVVKAHGVREMPVWGYRYTPTPNLAIVPFNPNAKNAIQYADTTYDPEVVIRTRILAVVDYLNRIQEK